MPTAREIMTGRPVLLEEHQTLAEAARLMRDEGVGALPVRRDDGSLLGIVTDRDIVVGPCADGQDLGQCRAGDHIQGGVTTVGPDDTVDRLVDVMGREQVKRLPVVDGEEVVGIISEADLARHVADDQVEEFVRMVYGRP